MTAIQSCVYSACVYDLIEGLLLKGLGLCSNNNKAYTVYYKHTLECLAVISIDLCIVLNLQALDTIDVMRKG